jgi:hypothetical protein
MATVKKSIMRSRVTGFFGVHRKKAIFFDRIASESGMFPLGSAKQPQRAYDVN